MSKKIALRFASKVGPPQLSLIRSITDPFQATIVLDEDGMGVEIFGLPVDDIPRVAQEIIANGGREAEALPVDDWSAFESAFDTEGECVEIPQSFGVSA